MSRSRHAARVSRGLIGLLLITIALGLIAYFHNTSRSNESCCSDFSV